MSAHKSATTRHPSRRSLLQIATAAGVPGSDIAAADDPGKLVAEWYCALEEKQRALHLSWQDVETWLFKHHNWPYLTEAQQSAVPEAAQLRMIDDQLEILGPQIDLLIPLLKTTSATTRDGVFARLDALRWLLNPDDNEDAYPLLRSCQSDLKRLWR